MKRIFVSLTGLASAVAAFAQVDPSRPMVTGRGNVSAPPVRVIVTNKTQPSAMAKNAAAPGDTVALEKFMVTGSLIRPASTEPGASAAPKPASAPRPAK